MGNNMDLDYEMFCYQCEQTANGKGCTKMGVCGKTPEIAGLQDLLIYQIKGISCYGKVVLDHGEHMNKEIVRFIENVLFTTLTNVNFDAEVHVKLLRQSQKIKEELRGQLGKWVAEMDNPTAQADYQLPEDKTEMLKDAPIAGIMYDKELDPDIRSLRQTVLYGLKGISAYGHQARELGYYSDQVDDFYIQALEAITDDRLTVEELIRLTMRTGEIAIEVMKKLDDANTERYGNPSLHKVNVRMKKGPFIVVSGHDLKDLEMLLEQTKGMGISIYTHGEMLPSHGYDGLKKYPHLVGNFGGAWQDQQKELEHLPGAILMTTNCLMRPRDSYKDRILVVEGGSDRNSTIENIILAIDELQPLTDEDIIVTHDSVRPFVSLNTIQENIELAKRHDVVDTVVEATDTIVQSLDNTFITDIPERQYLYQGQTPQTFKMKDFLALYHDLSDQQKEVLTDACKIFVINGKKVALAKGEYSNIKITTITDLKIARGMIEDN